MRKKILVLCDMPESFFEKANQNEKYQFDQKLEENLSSDDFLNAEGIVFTTKTIINSEFLNQFSNLKFIGRSGSGLDNVDIQEVEKRNISIYSSPEGNCDAVAEHTLAVLLSLLNNILVSDSELKHGVWKREENRGKALSECTVGIIGHGHTGSAVVNLLHAFKCKILVVDPNPRFPIPTYAQLTSMEELYQHSDVISFHTPLTESTKYLGCLSFFQSFSKPITLLNMSRGEVVNLNDLLIAFQKGFVNNIGIDVYHDEQQNLDVWRNEKWYQEFSQSKHVIMTPHIAGWNSYSKHALGIILLEKIFKEN